MSELAFTINGETFDLPATATGWRVRRMKQRGAPEVVYGKDGVPLLVPIESGLEELRAVVGTPGRYRLDAVDDRGRTVEDLPASYVVIPARDPAPPPHEIRNADGGASFVMAEAMRMNTELAKAVVDRFPQMVEAAASLLRAADGAGLPSRQPAASTPGEEDDDDDVAPQPAGFDLNALVAQLLPMLLMSLGNGKAKLPSLGSVLDWRKATPDAQPTDAKAKAIAEATATVVPENATDVLPPIDAQTMTHFIAIQSALKPEEAAMARDVASNLSATELHAWFDELKKLTVPQAVQKIRVLIAGNTEAVS